MAVRAAPSTATLFHTDWRLNLLRKLAVWNTISWLDGRVLRDVSILDRAGLGSW
jgi:hypothetical protein